jgi:hypothetical protein
MISSDQHEDPNAFIDEPLAAAAAEYCDLMRAAGARLFALPDGSGRWEDYTQADGGRPLSPRLHALMERLYGDAGQRAIAAECRQRGWILPVTMEPPHVA